MIARLAITGILYAPPSLKNVYTYFSESAFVLFVFCTLRNSDRPLTN